MDDSGSKNATIRDVARLAGCGIATVSRVLNDSGAASADSRRRVMSAVAELGFEISDVGRSLRNQVTRTIGCIVPSISNPVYGAAVQGLQQVATAQQHQILLACTGYDPEQEIAAVRTLVGKRVDAMVLTTGDAENAPAIEFLKARQLPFCLLFNHTAAAPHPGAVDNFAAGCRVGEAFAEMGHRYLGYVALRLQSSDRARQRLSGVQAACRAAGLKSPVLLEIEEQANDLDTKLLELLSENPSLTGIFASNDLVAISLIAALRRLGLNVPEDMSVIGFDGIDFGQMTTPTLATIVTDPCAMGRASADMVLSYISNTVSVRHATEAAKFEFRSGESLGAPADGQKLADKITRLRQRFSPQ